MNVEGSLWKHWCQ